MFNYKKITAFFMSAAMCFCASATVNAVGTDELSISANTVGTYELQIDMKNTSEYYLANVDIKVEGAKNGAQIESYGFSAGDSIRVVAPGESISAYATLDPSSIPVTTTKTPSVTQSKPTQTNSVQTTKPSQNATVQNGQSQNNQNNQNNQSNNDVLNNDQNDAVNNAPSYNDDQTPEYTDPAVQGDATDSTADEGTEGTDTDVSASDTEGEGTDVTTIHTIHSMSPGEETTIYATLAGGSESEPVKVMPADEIPSYTIWIALGVVAVLGVAAFIVIKKKKKNAAKDVASVIVAAILLTSLVAGEAATVVKAAELKEAVAGSVSKTVELSGGKGTITITVDYTVVPAAKTEALKSARRVPAGDECDTPVIDERRLVEGAGPLTSHGIYIGENDFMFYGAAINDYNGKSVMASARMNKLVSMMNDRDSWAKANGIKLYLVIAPNKTTVYPEYVPDKVNAADKTNADIALEYLASSSSVEVIDLRQSLINAKSEYGDSLFYKYDTHWNNNGGFVGYTEIMRRINEDVAGAYTLKKSDFNIADYETYMKDMAYYLGYYSKYVDYGPVYTLKSGMTATIGQKENDGYWGQFRFCQRWADGYSDALKYITYENKYNTDAPSVYVYRDSFAVSLVHFLKDSFHNSVFDWSYDFNKKEILASGADIVIMEVVEKQLEEFVNSRTFSD